MREKGSSKFFFILLSSLLLSSCATKPTIYTAPDASKVNATAKRLSAASAKEGETWHRAEVKVQDAQKSSDKIAAHSASVLNLLRDLEPSIPREALPKFNELKAATNAQIVEEGNLTTAISGAQTEIEQGHKDHAAVLQQFDQLVQVDFPKYQADSKWIAEAATKESAEKVEYRKQLTSQKILGWLWKLGGGAVVIVIIALVVLWWTGRIAFNVSKGVAKL